MTPQMLEALMLLKLNEGVLHYKLVSEDINGDILML